jgi:hypothetical protein
MSVCTLLFETWGRPFVDLFATSENRRLDHYFSPLPDPWAWGMDALSQDWNGMFAYLFPPFTLLQLTLKKIAGSCGLFILMAPGGRPSPGSHSC